MYDFDALGRIGQKVTNRPRTKCGVIESNLDSFYRVKVRWEDGATEWTSRQWLFVQPEQVQ
jgi:hypothetical protein